MIKIPSWEPHLQDFVSRYSKNFYWSTDQFLDHKTSHQLLEFAKKKEDQGLLKPAAIGKGILKKTDPDVRSDFISWVNDFSTPEGKIVFNIFEELKLILRKDFYLPAKRFECHFSKYEPGSFYKRHQDRHKDKPGRIVSCILYLTECPKQTGNLILYDENLKPIKITPAPGRIVVFNSELEHEVTTSLTDRWSLTGWIRDDLHPGLRI